MNITGKNSISKYIKIILQLIFVLGIIAFVGLPIITNYLIKLWDLDMNGFKVPSLIIFYPTGICVLVIVYNFIDLFESLKQNNPFTMNTVKRLRNSMVASVIISVIYTVVTIYSIICKDVTVIVFALIIAGVFIVFSVAMYILAELFKQAVKFKEENELTI